VSGWARLDGEPTLWYERFERFRLAGPGRSLLKLYNEEREKAGKGGIAKRVPGAWDEAVKIWQWDARADAWDAAQLAEEATRREAEIAKEREEARANRRAMLKAYGSRVAQGLQLFDPKKMTPADVSRGVDTYLDQSRAEYDDEPTQRIREEPTPPVPWELVPEEMQVAYLERQITLSEVLAYVAKQRQSGS
jgi:hypothetical protein